MRLLAILIGLTAVSFVLQMFAPDNPCQGGKTATTLWEAEKGSFEPFVANAVVEIDPKTMPHTRVIVVEHTGNRAYGEKNDQLPGHLHPGVYRPLIAAGVNGYFHQHSKFDDDQATTQTVGVIVYAGPISDSIKEQCAIGDQAALISRVTGDSSAERSGLRRGDVICRVDGETLPRHLPAKAILARADTKGSEGAKLVFQVIRDGTLHDIDMHRVGGKFGFTTVTVPAIAPATATTEP